MKNRLIKILADTMESVPVNIALFDTKRESFICNILLIFKEKITSSIIHCQITYKSLMS